MTSFDELFAAAGTPALLDLHGETASYVRKGQAPRAVTVIVDRSQELEAGPLDVEHDRISVLLRQDATLGIVYPQLGDDLRLAAASDPDQQPYRWTGEAPDALGGLLRLTFQRRRLAFGRAE